MASVMRIFAIAMVLLFASAQPAFADVGNGEVLHFGPYAGASLDSGTCGNWAEDTFKRFFTVTHANGTWYVREDFRNGHFVTVAGASPGACETSSAHGSQIAAGVRGEFQGMLGGVVTGGTFDAGATCPNPCRSLGFVAAHFGAGAAWEAAQFLFTYHASGGGLAYRAWQNASPDLGGNVGDIASR